LGGGLDHIRKSSPKHDLWAEPRALAIIKGNRIYLAVIDMQDVAADALNLLYSITPNIDLERVRYNGVYHTILVHNRSYSIGETRFYLESTNDFIIGRDINNNPIEIPMVYVPFAKPSLEIWLNLNQTSNLVVLDYNTKMPILPPLPGRHTIDLSGIKPDFTAPYKKVL